MQVQARLNGRIKVEMRTGIDLNTIQIGVPGHTEKQQLTKFRFLEKVQCDKNLLHTELGSSSCDPTELNSRESNLYG